MYIAITLYCNFIIIICSLLISVQNGFLLKLREEIYSNVEESRPLWMHSSVQYFTVCTNNHLDQLGTQWLS